MNNATARPRGGRYEWLTGAMIWVAFYILAVPPNYFDQQEFSTDTFGTPNPFLRTVKLGLIGVSLIVIFSRLAVARPVVSRLNRFYVLFMSFAILSVLWSIDPGATINRFISALASILPAIAFAVAGWNARRFQSVLRPIITLLMIGSLLAGMYSIDMVLEKGEAFELKGAWHGMTYTKNTFGQLSGLGLILWFHGLISRQTNRFTALLGIGLSLLCVVLSRSSTSLFSGTFACFFMFLVLTASVRMRKRMPYIVGTFATVVLTYAVAVLNVVPGLGILLEPFVLLSGKDMTFSNRVIIWDIIKEHIRLSPFVGSGYGAYWVGPFPNSPSFVFTYRMYIYPTESHNGYLEIINDLGYAGLALFMGYLFRYIRQCLDVIKFDRSQGTLFLGVLFHQITTNFSESTFMVAASFCFFVLTLATASQARVLYEQRKAAAVAPR